MAEYIKRESLMKRFCERCNEEMSESPCEPSACFAREVIKTFPAADVAPVVRCRDCKHAWIHPRGYVYCHRDGRSAYEMTFNLDSFCSYGERNDNG